MLTDKLFTGQRDTGLGIYNYGARFYSPYINRFLSADTIVPGYANPQALNRYSYTFNSPLNYIDPNGHDPWWCDSSSDSNSCYAEYTTDDNGVIGGHDNHHNDDHHNGDSDDPLHHSDNPDFFSGVSYTADIVGVVASDIEFIVVDTMGTLVIAEGCATAAACIPAIAYALAIDIGVSSFSPLDGLENFAGLTALLATGIEDGINGTTYIQADNNGGYNIGVGQDTVVSAANFVAGLAPEANYDAWISNQQLEYDNSRRNGELPTVSLFEFHVSQPPNLWGNGNGWPNTLP